MTNRKLSLLLSILWPGLGHIYLKKPLGFVYFFVWMFVFSRLLQVFPVISVMVGYQKLPLLPFTNLIVPINWGVAVAVWGGLLYDTYTILNKNNKESFSVTPFLLVPFFIIISVYIYLSLPLKLVSSKAALGNLHSHTLCSDGAADYEQTIRTALGLGFDFIAPTDHRFSKLGDKPAMKIDEKGQPREFGYNDEVCHEVFAKCSQETRLLCLPSQEVTGRVHILAVGIKEHIEFPPSEGRPGDDIRIVNENDLTGSGFDAMECDRASWSKNQL